MQINDDVIKKLLKRVDKLESEVYYLNKFKKEVERKEYIKECQKRQEFLEKNRNKL